MGQCLEIPQARGQGNTKKEAIEDTKKAIKVCKSYLESKKKLSNLVTVSI
jgi:predicted RNase H-like HicB family nuclease